MTHPPTPNDIVLRLAQLSRMLDEATAEVGQLDEHAVRTRQAFKVAEARAFLTSEGAMDIRKRLAILATDEQALAAEIAEQKVRACQERIRTLRVQVEVGRSLGAAQRSEWNASAVQT